MKKNSAASDPRQKLSATLTKLSLEFQLSVKDDNILSRYLLPPFIVLIQGWSTVISGWVEFFTTNK